MNKNKGVLGKFKNETPEYPIQELVCIRSKCYAIKL